MKKNQGFQFGFIFAFIFTVMITLSSFCSVSTWAVENSDIDCQSITDQHSGSEAPVPQPTPTPLADTHAVPANP